MVDKEAGMDGFSLNVNLSSSNLFWKTSKQSINMNFMISYASKSIMGAYNVKPNKHVNDKDFGS